MDEGKNEEMDSQSICNECGKTIESVKLQGTSLGPFFIPTRERLNYCFPCFHDKLFYLDTVCSRPYKIQMPRPFKRELNKVNPEFMERVRRNVIDDKEAG